MSRTPGVCSFFDTGHFRKGTVDKDTREIPKKSSGKSGPREDTGRTETTRVGSELGEDGKDNNGDNAKKKEEKEKGDDTPSRANCECTRGSGKNNAGGVAKNCEFECSKEFITHMRCTPPHVCVFYFILFVDVLNARSGSSLKKIDFHPFLNLFFVILRKDQEEGGSLFQESITVLRGGGEACLNRKP